MVQAQPFEVLLGFHRAIGSAEVGAETSPERFEFAGDTGEKYPTLMKIDSSGDYRTGTRSATTPFV